MCIRDSTYPLGELTEDERLFYTWTLQCHIDIAKAVWLDYCDCHMPVSYTHLRHIIFPVIVISNHSRISSFIYKKIQNTIEIATIRVIEKFPNMIVQFLSLIHI